MLYVVFMAAVADITLHGTYCATKFYATTVNRERKREVNSRKIKSQKPKSEMPYFRVLVSLLLSVFLCISVHSI